MFNKHEKLLHGSFAVWSATDYVQINKKQNSNHVNMYVLTIFQMEEKGIHRIHYTNEI